MMETFYLAFADGTVFVCPPLTKRREDSQASSEKQSCGIVVLPLEEEHTSLGRALVDALWFARPVKIMAGQKTFWAKVYRCHIAGPVFKEMLWEVRAENPRRDMASAWELHLLKETEPMDVSQAKEVERSFFRELHLDHPVFHEG